MNGRTVVQGRYRQAFSRASWSVEQCLLLPIGIVGNASLRFFATFSQLVWQRSDLISILRISGVSIELEMKREAGVNPAQDRCCIRRETWLSTA